MDEHGPPDTGNRIWYPGREHSPFWPLVNTCRDPSFIRCQSQCSNTILTIGMKNVRHLAQWKFVIVYYSVDHCTGHRTCETLISHGTAVIPVISNCLSFFFLFFFFLHMIYTCILLSYVYCYMCVCVCMCVCVFIYWFIF
jgi:hypothetical protein